MPTYHIPKGSHRADGINFKPVFWKRGASYVVCFSPSCLYDIGPDQKKVNKLCGWGHVDHRANSVRYGWRCIGDKIELLGYLHLSPNCFGKGEIREYTFSPNLYLEINKEYHLTLTMQQTGGYVEYFFGVFDPISSLYIGRLKVQRPNLSWIQRSIGTTMNPWFGGTVVAPHDIYVGLEEL